MMCCWRIIRARAWIKTSRRCTILKSEWRHIDGKSLAETEAADPGAGAFRYSRDVAYVGNHFGPGKIIRTRIRAA